MSPKDTAACFGRGVFRRTVGLCRSHLPVQFEGLAFDPLGALYFGDAQNWPRASRSPDLEIDLRPLESAGRSRNA